MRAISQSFLVVDRHCKLSFNRLHFLQLQSFSSREDTKDNSKKSDAKKGKASSDSNKEMTESISKFLEAIKLSRK